MTGLSPESDLGEDACGLVRGCGQCVLCTSRTRKSNSTRSDGFKSSGAEPFRCVMHHAHALRLNGSEALALAEGQSSSVGQAARRAAAPGHLASEVLAPTNSKVCRDTLRPQLQLRHVKSALPDLSWLAHSKQLACLAKCVSPPGTTAELGQCHASEKGLDLLPCACPLAGHSNERDQFMLSNCWNASTDAH